MTLPLENLKSLVKNMKDNNWIIDSFLFEFNQERYIVVVNLDFKSSNNLVSSELIFYDYQNIKRSLKCLANRLRLFIDDSSIFDFFNIQPTGRFGNAIEYFLTQLGESIPPLLSKIKSEGEKQILQKLAVSLDSNKNGGPYCYKTIRHNGNKRRSKENNTKTKILRPELYEIIGNDHTISFCFSNDPSLEKNDAQILANLNHFI